MLPKFLVIDDDAEVHNLIRAMLGGQGCELESRLDSEKVYEELKEPSSCEKFDAIFLDISMPGKNGYEILELIRSNEHSKNIPVLMLTALDGAQNLLKGYQQGANYYIPKPFTQSQLIFALDTVLGEEQPSHEEDDGDRKKKKIVYDLPEA